jgi:hypothetical protein
MDDPKIPEPIQDQVQPTDDLAIPTYLQRKPLDPVASEIKAEQDGTKRLKARGRIERMKARKSGAMTAMPLTGKAALDAIRETDEEFLREAAARLHMRLSRTAQDIIEIGRDLIAVKDRVGHGNFLPWIDREFGMTEDTAQRLMSVARNMADQIPQGAVFQRAVLYALAAPSTTPEVRAEIVDRAAAGEKITVADVRAVKGRSDVKKKAVATTSAGTALKRSAADISKADRAEAKAREVAKAKEAKPKPDPATSLVDQIDDTCPATHLVGEISRFADFCKQNHAATVAGRVLEHEVVDLKTQIATIEAWLGNFDVMLEQHKNAISAPVH